MKFSGESVIYFGFVVELFFVISGILVEMKSEIYRNYDFGGFMKNRLLRLMPMTTYSTVVFMSLVAVYYVAFGVWYSCAPLSPIMILEGLILVYCGGPIRYQNIEPNCILWYLCVLIICYAVYWIILFLTKRINVSACYWYAGMIMLGIGIKSYSIDLPFLNGHTARGYMAFFWGVLLVDIFRRISNKKIISYVSFSVLILLVIYGFSGVKLLFGDGLEQELTLTFIVYPAIIGFLVCTSVFDKLMNNRYTKFLGNISFEMYICQYHVFMLIHLLEGFGVIKYPRSDKGMLLATILIVLMSVLVYLFVEKPLRAFLIAMQKERIVKKQING